MHPKKNKPIVSKYLVTKANHMIEACYKLSTNEQKIILMMISMIEPQDEDFKTYMFKVSDIAQFLGLDDLGNAYNIIKVLVNDLRKKELNIYSVETNTMLNVGWLSSSKYYIGEGYVELEFSPKLKPYLLGLKECFLKYHFKNIIHLKSSYSIRIYELLKQYEKLGERNFEVKILRKILGIAKKEYERYNDFKKNVILVAHKEIPEKTDIGFDFKEGKLGRKVTEIKFTIHSKPKQGEGETAAPLEETAKPDNAVDKLYSLLPKEQEGRKTILDVILQAYSKHGAEYVMWNICYTNKNVKDNYLAYLVKALKENWGAVLKENVEAQERIKEEERKAIVAKRQKEKEDAERLEKEREACRMADEYIKKLSPEKHKELREQAIGRLDPKIQKIIRDGDEIMEAAARVEMVKIVVKDLI